MAPSPGGFIRRASSTIVKHPLWALLAGVVPIIAIVISLIEVLKPEILKPSDTTGGQTQRPGDLGLTTPISDPVCDGQGIVILGSVTTRGLYAAGVQQELDAHPGAFYLRTDQTCPSLRQTDDEGDPIYAVFKLGGRTEAEVCAAVREAGGDAYGKWLDTTTDPAYIIPC